MSPSLITKYLDAAKEVASHAVLLPDGFRFSQFTTRRDWTNESLTRIREFYARFSDDGGGEQVNLQGIVLQTNRGGLLPLEKYLAATLAERESLVHGRKSLESVARERSLSKKYLSTLWNTLTVDADKPPAPWLDRLRGSWRTATVGDAPALAADIARWQKTLWRFTSVGHLGRTGGPTAWMEPVDPLMTRQEFRLTLPESPAAGSEIVVRLTVGDAEDGNEQDFVVWERPRLEFKDHPPVLLRDVRSWLQQVRSTSGADAPLADDAEESESRDGPDPGLFGKHPNGAALDRENLCVKAPMVLEVLLPADLAGGVEFVATGTLHAETAREGSVQLRATATTRASGASLPPAADRQQDEPDHRHMDKPGFWPDTPILVMDGSNARQRILRQLDEFRQLFPAALCYTKIVPVDEVVTLTLFHREDDQLRRLILDDTQTAQLDRLWDELHFISHEPLALVDVYEQLAEFATQDRPDLVEAFKPLRRPIEERAAAFRKQLIDAESRQLDALTEFAARAIGAPSDVEARQLRELYDALRRQELPHDEAFRLTLARILVSPTFLYRIEKPGPGPEQVPVSDMELACRLSYFLWSSQPDDQVRQLAAAGQLSNPEILVAQTRRMLRDAKSRRLATEFACQWLHIYEFDKIDEKSERHFPTFLSLRGAMHEESIRFFTDLFQNDGSVLSLLDADHTFLNEELARHYGIPGITGSAWRRVDGVRQFDRGGILTLASILAKQSGASRTSPILRGNWLSEVVLGERLPRPPKNVPQLADTVPEGLTERQLIERHTSDPACSKCHARIDPFGFALEHYDAIGRFRHQDISNLPIDARTTLPDGTQINGLDGLRDYLLTARRLTFVRQFNRKLLGYALGRAVQLSDEPLLDEMQAALESRDYHMLAAFESIVLSRQFREIRGRESVYDE